MFNTKSIDIGVNDDLILGSFSLATNNQEQILKCYPENYISRVLEIKNKLQVAYISFFCFDPICC